MQRSKSSLPTRLSCAAAVIIAMGLGITPAQSQAPAATAPVPQPVPQMFEYAVKFVCGRSGGQVLQVAPGFYFTDVNVHNPNSTAITFRKKFVLALIEQKQSKPTDWVPPKEFGPDYAFAVECREILKALGSPPFATGFVVFQSPREMDIVAVYTTGATPSGPVSTFHTERVPKRP